MLATPFLTLDNEIDGEAFQLLSDDDMKDLVPLFGPRAKLIKKRNEATSMTVTQDPSSSGSSSRSTNVQVDTVKSIPWYTFN